MASLLIVLINTMYGTYTMYRVVQKREGNPWSLYVVFTIATLIAAAFTQYSVSSNMLSVAASAGCTVCEIMMIYIVGYWAIDDVWIQYARVLEAANVKTLSTMIFTSAYKALLRATFSKSAASYDETIRVLLGFILAILVSEILLKFNLYGKIPYLIWKWLLIANFTIVVINILYIIFTGSGLYETSEFVLFYLGGIIPLCIGIVVFIISIILVLKNEIVALEKYCGDEYTKYNAEANSYETIRELRHDLANHLQVMSLLDPVKKQAYLDELMEQLNGKC